MRVAPPIPSDVQILVLRPFASGMGSDQRVLCTCKGSPRNMFWLSKGIRETRLSFTWPFSSTRTLTSASSDSRDARTHPAVPPRGVQRSRSASALTFSMQQCRLTSDDYVIIGFPVNLGWSACRIGCRPHRGRLLYGILLEFGPSWHRTCGGGPKGRTGRHQRGLTFGLK